MKKIFFTAVIAALLITVISCKSKEQKEADAYMNKIEQTMKENSPGNTDDKPKSNAKSPNIPGGMENLLGEWSLVRRLRDDNGNGKIDEDEEKTATATTGYMKLNANGSCKYQTVMDGTYEIVTEDGRKRIHILDLHGDEFPISQYIVSVTENELVINTVLGGSGFEIYKRQ